jgi:hypothetical protein
MGLGSLLLTVNLMPSKKNQYVFVKIIEMGKASVLLDLCFFVKWQH